MTNSLKRISLGLFLIFLFSYLISSIREVLGLPYAFGAYLSFLTGFITIPKLVVEIFPSEE